MAMPWALLVFATLLAGVSETTEAQTTITKRVAASSDDAEEEGPTGTTPNRMWLSSSDIELVSDFGSPTAGVQKIGLRFTSMTIPAGATITGAYLIFRAIVADPGMTNSDTTSLTIKGQLAANASTFTSTSGNISGRSLTSASASWVPTTWTTGTDYNSPSIVSVIQELVNQGTWASGNAMAVIITGTGHRASPSWDKDAANAAQLVVTYTVNYYSKGSLAVSTASSWNTGRDGSGTDASSFGTGSTWIIQNAHAMTLTGSTTWNVSSSGIVQVESGGTWTNTSSGTVTTGTLQVDNGGTYAHSTTATFPGTTRTLGATSTVNYSASAQTVIELSYGHLTLSSSGTKTMPGTSMTLSGNFTMSGTASATAAQLLTVNGNFTLGSGTTFSAASFSHSVKGGFANSGTFNGNTSTFTFNGTGAQVISGSSATTFTALTINNVSGVSQSGVDATVSGTLTLTSGVITTGANTFSIGASGTVSRTSGHVVGNFRKNVATGATTRVFEIGDATNYTPVSVTFASVTTAGNLTASASAGDHANIGTATINSAKSVNRRWTMTNSGIVFTTYSATFTFVAGDIDAGAATGSFIVGNYSGGAWSYPTVGTKTGVSTQITGVSSFSDFQIGEYVAYTLSGNVFEDVNYGGGAGRSKAGSSGVSRSSARVELYTSAGGYSTFTTTDVSGNYSFTGLAGGTYYVRTVNASVTSSRTGYTSAALPVMTYRTAGSTGTAVAVTDFVGGTNPAMADPGNGSPGATFSTSTFVYSAVLSGTAHAVTPVVVSSGNVTGLDVGFNFNTVVNTNNTGQGSLRQFIDNATLLGGDASLAQAGLVTAKDNAVFMISNGTSAAGLRSTNNYFTGGIATISPNPGLSTVSTPMVLDAQKQPGWSTTPIIELNGTSAGATQNGFTVTGGATIIRGFIINRFTNYGIYLLTAGADTVQGNYVGVNAAGTAASSNTLHGIFANNIPNNLIGGTTSAARNVVGGNNYGVVIAGASATGNTISGNYVGLNAAGTAAIANSIGIGVEGAATGNTIGGTSTAARNVASGNTQMGVLLQNAGTSSNTVAGNYLGTNATGTAAVPNGTHGVSITNSATGNTVGGLTGTAGNLISGNTGKGIAIEGSTVSGNTVLGNLIGLNASGTTAIPNGSHGLYVLDSPSNTIGGTTAAARNVISGNTASGVYILGATATSNVVSGNYVGTNAAGTSAVANQVNGVWLEAAPNNTIGGTTAGAGNVISGNTNHGLWLFSTTNGTQVQGNRIGTNAAGTAAVPNAVHGLTFSGGAKTNTVGGTTASSRNVISGNTLGGIVVLGATTTGNIIRGNSIGADSAGTAVIGNGTYGVIVDAGNASIGDTLTGAGNVIANNGSDGVAVINAASGVRIQRNSIHSNGGLGIDLSDDGVTSNNGTKSALLPNSEMDAPVFTSVLLNGTSLGVSGYVGSAASQSLFASARVEIFKSSLDALGYGEGQAYLGFMTADASGNFGGTFTVSGLSSGDKVTATATDLSNNTSEFGLNTTVAAAIPSMTLVESVTPSGTQLPGTELAFSGAFTNTGTAVATSVVVSNPIPSNTDFKVGSETQSLGTTGLTVTVAWSNDGGATWVYTPVSGAGGAPAGYDRLVTRVRWTFSGSLSHVSPGNAGSVGITTRIR